MAFTKRKTIKKTFKKKAMPSRSLALKNSVNMGLGFPKKLLVKQKYNDTFIMESTLGVVRHSQFILNGLFDPTQGAGTRKPMYFDQYMHIYNHYTVIGTKMVVKFVPYESNTTPLKVALWINDDTTIATGVFGDIAEYSKAKSSLLSDSGGKATTLTLNWSAKKTFGGSMLSNELFRGNILANPPEQSVGVITIQSADTFATTQVAVQIHMEFITVYSELRDILGS